MIPNTLYDIMKWTVMIVIPAACSLLVGIEEIWVLGIPADQIARTGVVVCTFFGAILGISSAEYNKNNKNN